MGIRLMAGSDLFEYRFQYKGQGFQGSTGETDRRKAMKAEQAAKDAAVAAFVLANAANAKGGAKVLPAVVPAKVPGAKVQGVTIAQAIGRFIKDREADMRFKKIDPTAGIWPHEIKSFQWIVGHFGLNFLITDLRASHVRAMVAAKKALPKQPRLLKDGTYSKKDHGPRSAGDINRYTWMLLRRVHRYAGSILELPVVPIAWTTEPGIKQEEPEMVDREFSPAIESKFREAVDGIGRGRWREGYADMLEFGLMSGLRISNLVIKWKQVHIDLRRIDIIQKRRRVHAVVITDEMLELLKRQIGHDPTYVFTRVADRTTMNHKAGIKFEKDKRYPLTKVAFEMWFRRTAEKAGVEIGPHDMRRAALRDLYRTSGSRDAVMALSGHSTPAMLDRYLGTTTPDNKIELLNTATSARKSKRLAHENLMLERDSGCKKLAVNF